jgi:hypothetical protein
MVRILYAEAARKRPGREYAWWRRSAWGEGPRHVALDRPQRHCPSADAAAVQWPAAQRGRWGDAAARRGLSGQRVVRLSSEDHT